jgi:SnoaL-like domain
MDKQVWDWPHAKKWPRFSGEKIDIVKKMFLAGEAMNDENFVKFYTDDAPYQFSNFPIVYGPDGIRKASGSYEDKRSFLGQVEGVNHHLKTIWEIDPDTLVVEMDVTYVKHNGDVYTLPCADIVRFKGDMVSGLIIYINVSELLSLDQGPA